MANVYCQIKGCEYRSKRRSQSKYKAGEWLYKCTKSDLVIIPYIDGEHEYEENVVNCMGYSSNDEADREMDDE